MIDLSGLIALPKEMNKSPDDNPEDEYQTAPMIEDEWRR